MYNRYIPQSDGTHRRRPMQDSAPPAPPRPTAPPPPPTQPEPPVHQKPNNSFGVINFLKQILPRDFDIGDLIVVLLLLLMAADREEEQNNALLTMALYLFL